MKGNLSIQAIESITGINQQHSFCRVIRSVLAYKPANEFYRPATYLEKHLQACKCLDLCKACVFDWIIVASLSEPHINVKFVRSVGLSVFLSVRTFMTRKYARTVLIYGYLQLFIAAFRAGLVHWFVHQHSTNM